MSNARSTSKTYSEGLFWTFVAIAVVGGWSLFWAGQYVAGPGISFNPLDLVFSGLQPDSEVVISTGGVIFSAVVFIVLVATVVVLMGLRAKKKASRKGASVLESTKHMADAREVAKLSRKQVAQATARTNPDLPDTAEPGQLLGRELRSGKEVWLDYETLTVDIWAARYGKTTGRVLPMVLSAPSGAVATGNKPDLVTDSLAARQTVGECLVCDPQRIWMSPQDTPQFWVDLLDYIRRRPEDEWDNAAGDLARLFGDNAGVEVGSGGSDEQWRTSGAELMSCFLLAATVSDRSVLDILPWVFDESNREPVDLLNQYGYPTMALMAQGTYNLTEKTRSGVFFQLRNMVAPLTKKSLQRWLTPQAGVAKFNPSEFVAEHEAGNSPTLYLLSDDRSSGSASLLVLALVVWLTEAAEDASRRNGGRLRIPLIFPLDEAANVVKWGNLAEVYSHFGSKGIILGSIYQSFRQPKRIYGADNAHDMITNATLIVGGGIKDKEFLEEAISFVGEYSHRQVSVSSDSSSYKTNTSISERDRQILTVADLRGLDAHLMLVIPQKAAPMIVEAIPFWERTFRAEMRNADTQLDQAHQRAKALEAAENAGQAVA
jgi:type IV secretory pathway TraG/TraD family ATPase VirD4